MVAYSQAVAYCVGHFCLNSHFLYRNERVFVITCLSTTTRTEHAVLLWQPEGKEPSLSVSSCYGTIYV